MTLLKPSKGLRLYCFSPPVMVATFSFEIGLLIYTLLRYRLNSRSRLIGGLLLLLAIFQIAEFNVCGSFGISTAVWSRVGFIAITLLPALAIHLIVLISGRTWRWLTRLSYLTSGLFAIIFGFSSSAFVDHICRGNYVIFRLASAVGSAYYFYYYTWLFIGISLCLYLQYKAHNSVRRALTLQIIGYFSFLIPTAIANTVDPKTTAAIPSIMCGFAMVYALILAFGIAPLIIVGSTKSSHRL